MSKLSKENVEDLIALTPTQEGILLAYLKDPASPEYFVHSTLAIEGALDPERFERAWRTLVERHQALRSTFRWEKVSQPVQVVLKSHPPEVSFVDLEEAGGTFEDVKAKDRARGHDLGDVPFRVALVRTSDARHTMLLSYHHVILDGWSLGVLASEFLHVYRALGGEALAPLPAPAPLSRYVAWQKEQDAPAQKAFWARYFEGHEGGRGLAIKHAVSAASSPSAEIFRALDPELDRRLRSFAAAQGVTPATVLYAAFALLLEKYARTPDVVFGTTVSGRGAPVDGVSAMVGNFINTPPLRVRVEGGSVAELCAAVARAANERREFETTSTVEIRRALGVHEDPFDAIMVVENYPLSLAAEDLRLSQPRSDEATSYDLTVTVTVHEGLAVQWSYRDGRLQGRDVLRMAQRFEAVLRQFVDAPAAPIRDVQLMAPEERRAILEQFARGPVDTAVPATFLEGFLSAAAAAPDHPALSFGGATTTYAELDARSAALARRLLAGGLEPETPVAVLMERSDDWVLALVAIWRAGGAYVPISPRVPDRRVEHILRDSTARFLLVHDETAERVEGCAAGIRALNVDAPATDEGSTRPLPALRGEQLAYVIYTSGSSGEPKGVAVEHRALMNTIAWCADFYAFDRSTRALLLFDATADTSLEDIVCTLTRGGTLHVAPRELLFDGDGFRAYVRREGITFLSYLPGALRELLPGDERLPSLRHLVVGSEALPEDLKDGFLKLGYPLHNGYGTTEASIDSLTQRCAIGKPVTLGRPITNAGCLVLSPDGELCPIGVPGELALLGPGLARGYWRRDDLTEKSFVPCPIFAGERMYRTGDLASWQEDGEVRFLGRIDAQMKLNGFRVEPLEIERAIVAHEKVKEAAISAHKLSNGTTFLSAFVVCATSTELETKNLLGKGLRTFLADRLPEHMIPNRFFALEELPRLANDKVDLRRLESILTEADAQEYVPPADDVERQIAAIWGTVLGRDRVTTATPFRELGGDSLMLIRIYAQLNKVFPGVLKVQDLFDHRTIQELGAVIRERTAPKVEAGALNVLKF